jgi:hypothetical protein
VTPEEVEHAPPPTDNLDLDADHDGMPHRFCTLENILGSGSPLRYTDREVIEELLATISNELSTKGEALKIEEWRLAMLEEMASIEENKTWMVVNLLPGHRAIGLKWVLS